MGHNYLGTEHLLLGVLGAEEGLGAQALTGLGLTLDDAREQVVRRVGSDEQSGASGAPSTARAMDVLVLAWRAARNQNEIGSEHILIALLREGKGVAAHVLSRAKVTHARIDGELMRLRGLDASSANEPAADEALASLPDFERFTERARQVTLLAREEALALKHNYIGTEHILLGLLCEEEGLAAPVLKSSDLTADRVRAEVVRIVGVGKEIAPGRIPFTPRVRTVLEQALREARALDSDDIATHHLLLGLLRENDGVARAVLRAFEADPEELRSELLRRLPRD